MEKTTSILILITTLINAPALVELIKRYTSRNRSTAETKKDNASTEIMLSDGWKKYAEQQKKDKEDLRKEFTAQINSLKQLHQQEIQDLREHFNDIIKVKNREIMRLQEDMRELEKELEQYKNINDKIDTVKENMHTAIDIGAEQIKKEVTS
jgi:DNA repair exonuclease SbcCD ATPase subunit